MRIWGFLFIVLLGCESSQFQINHLTEQEKQNESRLLEDTWFVKNTTVGPLYLGALGIGAALYLGKLIYRDNEEIKARLRKLEEVQCDGQEIGYNPSMEDLLLTNTQTSTVQMPAIENWILNTEEQDRPKIVMQIVKQLTKHAILSGRAGEMRLKRLQWNFLEGWAPRGGPYQLCSAPQYADVLISLLKQPGYVTAQNWKAIAQIMFTHDAFRIDCECENEPFRSSPLQVAWEEWAVHHPEHIPEMLEIMDANYHFKDHVLSSLVVGISNQPDTDFEAIDQAQKQKRMEAIMALLGTKNYFYTSKVDFAPVITYSISQVPKECLNERQMMALDLPKSLAQQVGKHKLRMSSTKIYQALVNMLFVLPDAMAKDWISSFFAKWRAQKATFKKPQKVYVKDSFGNCQKLFQYVHSLGMDPYQLFGIPKDAIVIRSGL